MSDTATTAEATETDAETEQQTRPEVDWKSKAREWEKRAKANADAAARLAQFEESQKTEAQRLTEAVTAAEQRAAAAERESMRLKVIAESGLDPDLHEFVTGDTEDEVRAKAEKLKAKAAAAVVAPTTAPGPRADLSQGAKSQADVALNGDPLLADLKAKLGIN